MGYVLSLEIVQYWLEYMQKQKKQKKQKQKQTNKKSALFVCMLYHSPLSMCMYVEIYFFGFICQWEFVCELLEIRILIDLIFMYIFW